MAKKLTFRDLPSFIAMEKAKEEFEVYKLKLNDATDSRLEELENIYREKHLAYIHETINRMTKIPFNPTAKHFNIS